MAKKFISSDSSNEIKQMKDADEAIFDEETSCNDIAVYKESNPILDISILNTNFDLSTMPANYMRRRSKIEEIIYRAIYNQNCSKSPFSSFKTARDVLQDFNKIDIVTGINSLKKMIKSAYSPGEQISIIAHKVGSTWLLDEFELDKVMLRNHHFTEWTWLANFIKRQRFQLIRPNVRRSTIQSQDLFAKFLYHTVNHAHLALPSIESQTSDPLHVSPVKNEDNQSDFQIPETEQYKEDFLNVVDWKLEDLSFVVGSDLSIFGTKTHPCISLRLSPSQEPINVLTGIDIWLENLLNEVPEVAMCYHNEGIVMRDYEILQTKDIPNLAGFDRNEVQSIVKNLTQFLGTNATKEGHTYWLFKEADSPMVKLYDLTSIYSNESLNNAQAADTNPFILPVAILCYRLAEQRIKQWHKTRKSNITPTKFNQHLLNANLADNEFYFTEVFRLLKNCINLLLKINRHHDLIHLARIAMCCLYLEMDENTLDTLHEQSDNCSDLSQNEFSFNLTDLKSPLGSYSSSPPTHDDTDNPHSSAASPEDSRLNGTYLYELCKNKKTDDIVEYMYNSMGSEDQWEIGSVPPKEIIVRNTLLTKYERHKLDYVNTGLLESLRVYYKRKYDETGSLKCSFMVLLLNQQLCHDEKDDDVPELNNKYVSLKLSFMKDLICLNTGELISNRNERITSIDRRVVDMFYQERSSEILAMIKCVLMNEPLRIAECTTNTVMLRSWYKLVLSLIKLGIRLKKLKISKNDRAVLYKSIPVYINYLLSSIIMLYQGKFLELKYLADTDKKAIWKDWFSQIILPNLNLIESYNNVYLSTNHTLLLSSSNQIVDPSLQIMNWSNQARLSRLASIVDTDNAVKYLYDAFHSYNYAIECIKLIGDGTQSDLQLRHDRLNVCMLLLENSYGCVAVNNKDSVKELKKSLDCGMRLFQTESASPLTDDTWKLKLTGLRLRINNVKYFFNRHTGKYFNYQQILDEMISDFESIMKYRADTILRVQEAILILIYIFRIQADKADILAIDFLHNYLLEDCHLLQKLLSTKNNNDKDYFHGELGKSKLVEVYKAFRYILDVYLLKAKDCSIKKTSRKQKQKQLFKSGRIIELANEISSKYENLDVSQSNVNVDDILLEMTSGILEMIG